MNKTLYLPSKAINNIAFRGKTILLFKGYPEDYRTKKDALLIYNQDTGKYFGELKLDQVYNGKKFLIFLLYYYKHIAYIDGSIFSYLLPKVKYVAIEIHSYQCSGKKKTT